MPRLIEVSASGPHSLSLRYDDGVSCVVDLGDLVGKGVFRPLADPNRFAEVRLGEHGDVVWDDALDLCPDALYLQVTGKSIREAFDAEPNEPSHAGR
ncbi:DUF2442 domain-containing protein [Botrimarina sp.]|uniref:DUF2442 domain-containing protein n=1 Tax=Botrimarina sp. TaxID=2795802 RepID=UPI0032EE5AA2